MPVYLLIVVVVHLDGGAFFGIVFSIIEIEISVPMGIAVCPQNVIVEAGNCAVGIKAQIDSATTLYYAALVVIIDNGIVNKGQCAVS